MLNRIYRFLTVEHIGITGCVLLVATIVAILTLIPLITEMFGQGISCSLLIGAIITITLISELWNRKE